MDRLSVGLDAWVIQDGNYGDFAVGDDATFALEFWGADLRPSRSKQAVALHRGRGGYDVCAQVAFLEADVWVLDFGVFAYSESKPPEWARWGSWVEGRIDLGIDPFFYKEYLRKLPGMPRLFHDWTIGSILRYDTPWLVDSVDPGGKVLARDQANETWTSVVATDAWNDDEGRSSYILEVHRRAVEG